MLSKGRKTGFLNGSTIIILFVVLHNTIVACRVWFCLSTGSSFASVGFVVVVVVVVVSLCLNTLSLSSASSMTVYPMI
jgi:hypothetical protein